MFYVIAISTLGAGLLASAFAFAIAHDTRNPVHRRIARLILFATVAAMPVFMGWHLVQLALGGGAIQAGGKYSNSYVTYQVSPLVFGVTAFAEFVASLLPLAAVWSSFRSPLRKDQDSE